MRAHFAVQMGIVDAPRIDVRGSKPAQLRTSSFPKPESPGQGAPGIPGQIQQGSIASVGRADVAHSTVGRIISSSHAGSSEINHKSNSGPTSAKSVVADVSIRTQSECSSELRQDVSTDSGEKQHASSQVVYEKACIEEGEQAEAKANNTALAEALAAAHSSASTQLAAMPPVNPIQK